MKIFWLGFLGTLAVLGLLVSQVEAELDNEEEIREWEAEREKEWERISSMTPEERVEQIKRESERSHDEMLERVRQIEEENDRLFEEMRNDMGDDAVDF